MAALINLLLFACFLSFSYGFNSFATLRVLTPSRPHISSSTRLRVSMKAVAQPATVVRQKDGTYAAITSSDLVEISMAPAAPPPASVAPVAPPTASVAPVAPPASVATSSTATTDGGNLGFAPVVAVALLAGGIFAARSKGMSAQSGGAAVGDKAQSGGTAAGEKTAVKSDDGRRTVLRSEVQDRSSPPPTAHEAAPSEAASGGVQSWYDSGQRLN